MSRPRLTVGAAVAVAALAGCSVVGGGAGHDSGVEPVTLAHVAPAYAAMTREGLLVRAGDDQRTLPDASHAAWLPDGRVLTNVGRGTAVLRVVDPARGPVGPDVATDGFDLPGRSVTQVNVPSGERDDVLTAYSLRLEKLWTLRLPATDDTRTPIHAGEFGRSYHGVAATIDGVTFRLWSDGSEHDDEEGDRGLVRIEGGESENVAVNERLVALYLSADGAALLALRQQKGDPCGGCKVEQEIVEIDHRDGGLVEYGVPDGYDRSWRVDAMDKVGDRVAVRFLRSSSTGDRRTLIGTYVHEGGDWSMLEGSDREVTWWQGGDRVVARPAPSEGRGRDGYRLSWLHDGEETALPGELEGSFGRRYGVGSVAGQLLPPD